jgi:ribonuclease D
VNLSSARLQSLQEAIDTVEAMKPKEYPQLEPRKIMPESTLGAYELLKLLLKVQCDEHKVAQKLVASKEDLQEWLTEKDPIIPALHGWRYEVFGKYAEKMLSGELAFRLDKKTGALKLESLSA